MAPRTLRTKSKSDALVKPVFYLVSDRDPAWELDSLSTAGSRRLRGVERVLLGRGEREPRGGLEAKKWAVSAAR